MSLRYMIKKNEQRYTLHVTPETYQALKAWANRYDLTMVEATYLTIQMGMLYYLRAEKNPGKSREAIRKVIRDFIDKAARERYQQRGLRLNQQEMDAAE